MVRDIGKIKDRIAGCLWGQAIGDALGLGTEFMSRDEVSHNYPEGLSNYSQIGEDFGRWTDDTDMMLCIAMAIIADKDVKPKTIAHNFKEWYKSSPVDIGVTTAKILSLYEYEAYPYEVARMMWERSGKNNAGNGGVMRTSVVGLWDENVAENAERICRLTHADPRCIGSCVIISELIDSLVWQDKELPFEKLLQIGEQYDGRIKPYLETARNGKLEDFELDDEQTMGYTLKTMGSAVWCLYHVENFVEGLLKVVNAGGDADTNAAVACAVLGAKYGKKGIPEYYVQNLKRKDEYEEMIGQLTNILLVRK